ncbi:RHS repeat-associated core domain-containing protein, partial [Sulfuricurvum sp.]|uniref:RHS repeat-associated core domain-containing protein n=1 Tax=Sulfuricurvum sp. TaxID=2025608 RepID=UPI00263665A4
MAKNFGARKNAQYKVVSTSPSVNKTPRGPSIPPIPYDVQQDLSSAEGVSPNVNFNGDPVYVKTSHSSKVTGDAQGSAGGIKSGTVGAQSDPIEASPSVFVNGKAVVRVGDVQHMQNKNTVGKVVSSESGSAAHITDEGKIEGNTRPEPIAMPYSKNKPTNNTGSGSLGSRTGSPVLLASGKLFYETGDVSLKAPIPILLERHYISDERIGMFGKGWQCLYETRLIRSDPSTLSLVFTDDRTFRFTYSDEGFIDADDLGVSLVLLSPQTFLVEYFNDMHTERYENGYLSEIKDANGNSLKLIRENNGKLLHIASSDTSLSFEYNQEGFVSRVRDHTFRAWSYTYDSVHESQNTKHYTLTHVTDPMGGVVCYVYQNTSPYRLEQIIDPSGVSVLEVTYDPSGRVESYRENGESFSYRYQPNRVIKTDSLGDKTFYGIDNWGAIRAITYPDGTTTREEYHDDTSVVIDEGGNTHIRVFDKRHRLIREVRPDKSIILYGYEGNNPYPLSLSVEEKQTLFTYDERFNRTSRTTPDGLSESWSYDDRGNIISYTDSAGIATSLAYNNMGWPLRISDAMGGVTQYVYDELGNNTTVIDPNEQIEHFSYDRLSNLISITQTQRVPHSVSTAPTIHFTYDPAGRFSTLSDSSGNVTQYLYDAEGFLSRVIAPDKTESIYSYTKGHLSSIETADGERIDFTHDKRGRVLSKSSRDKTILFTYDDMGNLTRANDGINTVEYVYTTNAQVQLERQGSKSVSHAYSMDGSKHFIGYEGMHYNLMRDSSGNIASIRRALENYTLAYDQASRQTSLTYPNRIESKSAFDPLGRLTNRSLGEQPFLSYQYDKTSRIVQKNNLPITYDSAYRVLQVGNENYTYDDAGNLLGSNTHIDPITQRLMRQGDTHYRYDIMGRLTQKNSPTAQTTYTYDSEGYLIEYVRKSVHGSTGSPRTNTVRTELVEVQLIFTYDPLGRRLTKHFKSLKVSLSNHETISEYHHRYLYDGADIVAIYDADTDTLLATLLHDEAVDSPLSISVHPTKALTPDEQRHYETLDESEQYLFNQSRIKRYFYHRDHQNSIIALSDDNAQIVEYYEYDAYGNITKSEHTKELQTLNPYRYTGREFDTDDLYYYRARYYDPTIGRFITPDPIGFLGGDTNFYRYVGNDPINYADPLGLNKCQAIEDKLSKAKKKALEKLEKVKGLKKLAGKKLAKKAATLPLKAVPILGWAMAAYDVYDTVATGIEIAGEIKEGTAVVAEV